MKKSFKFLVVITVVSLILFAGCKHKVESNMFVKPADVSNLTIGESEISYSALVGIQGGTVIGNPSYAINGYDGVFSVKGRNLTIPSYQMGAYEVTQRLYKAVMDGDTNAVAEPSSCNATSTTYVYSDANENEKDLRPVDNVTWFDAVYFCNKLSEKTGKVPYYEISDISRDSQKHITSAKVTFSSAEGASAGYRLPTEAEWEYAARGTNPKASNWNKFFAGKASSSKEEINSDLDSVGWYWYNTGNEGKTIDKDKVPSYKGKGYGTHRVGLKAPVSDSLRLYDMSGNVWEWCQDAHFTYPAEAQTDPCPKADSTYTFVMRGGAWNCGQSDCRYTSRSSFEGTSKNSNLGLRLALTK